MKKRITIMVPMSWDDEQIARVKKAYEDDGYEVLIMTVPG